LINLVPTLHFTEYGSLPMFTLMRKFKIGIVCFLLFNLSCVQKPDIKIGPEIVIISPKPDEILNGMVSVLIQSNNLDKINKVELWVDGIQTGFYSKKEPFTIHWETSAWEDGKYYISVRSYDKQGNFYDTEPFPVELDNTVNWTFYNSTNSVLPETGLRYITTCEDGTVWAAYNFSAELYKYDGVTWEVVTIVKDSFPGFYLAGIECYNDTIWGGIDGYPSQYLLFKYYEGEKIEFHQMGEGMNSSGGIDELEIDREGKVWFSTNINILGYFNGKNFRYWKYGIENTDTTVAMYQDDGSVAGLVFDLDNNLWIAGLTHTAHYQAELGKWDGSQWIFQPMPHTEWVNHMVIDDQQNIWLIQYGGFLTKYDLNGQWTVIDSVPYSYWTNRLAVDKDGWVWVVGTGVAKYNGETWKIFTGEGDSSFLNNIYDIEIDDQNVVWMAKKTGGGQLGGVIMGTNH